MNSYGSFTNIVVTTICVLFIAKSKLFFSFLKGWTIRYFSRHVFDESLKNVVKEKLMDPGPIQVLPPTHNTLR
jgi:hypothetical protein